MKKTQDPEAAAPAQTTNDTAVDPAAICSPLDLGRLMAALPKRVFQRVSLHELQNIVRAYNTGECPECSGGRKTGIECQRCHGAGMIEFPKFSVPMLSSPNVPALAAPTDNDHGN